MTNWIEWDKIAPTFTTPATTNHEEPNDFYCDPAEYEDNSTAQEPFDQNQYNTFKAMVKAYKEGK